jgi:hypothetical protein
VKLYSVFLIVIRVFCTIPTLLRSANNFIWGIVFSSTSCVSF